MRRPIYRLERDKQYFNSRFDPSGLGRTVLQIPDEIRHESCFGSYPRRLRPHND